MKPPPPPSMPTSTSPPLPPPITTSVLPPMPTSTPPSFYLPFNLVHRSIPDTTYQLKQSSQPWRNDRPSLNKIQSNIEQPSQCSSKFVSNQPQIQWPIHVQGIKSKEDFTQKWMGKRISNWPSRDPRMYNRNTALVSELF